MARPLRIEYPGAWYHVLNRGRRKEKIFFTDRDFPLFLDLLGDCFRLFELEVHAYALMPNHYHLLVRTPLGNLSRAMRHLDGVYTQKINRRYSLEGSLLRGRFKSILVERESYLLALVRYVHRNPLKAGLEASLGTYPWTSYPAYSGMQEAPPWLYREVVLNEFASDKTKALEAFKKFIREKSTNDNLEKRLDGPRWPAILGNDFFRDWAKKRFFEDPPKKGVEEEVPQLKELTPDISLEELLQIVSKTAGLSVESILKVRRGRENFARRAFIYLARKNSRIFLREIAEKLGSLGTSSISGQYALAIEDLLRRTGCYRFVSEVEKVLKRQIKT